MSQTPPPAPQSLEPDLATARAGLSAQPETSPHQQVTVAAVKWTGVLEFAHLFRTFRLAINPGRLIIALLAIMAIYLSGRLFDLAWGPLVAPGEITMYQTLPREMRRVANDAAAVNRSVFIREQIAAHWPGPGSPPPAEVNDYAENPRAAYRYLAGLYEAEFHRTVEAAAAERAALEASRAGAASGPFAVTPTRSAEEIEQSTRRAAAMLLQARMAALRQATGRGVFESLMAYELRQFGALRDNTLTFIRVSPVRRDAAADGGGIDGQALQGGLVSQDPARLWRSDTVVGCVINMTVTAPLWLFTASGPLGYRPADADTPAGWWRMAGTRAVYLLSLIVLVGFWFLCVAISGAMICRSSAMEFAGRERTDLKGAWRFARGRLWDFIRAPLLPFAILLVLGGALAVLGLLGAIPGVGQIIVGLLFVLALGIGFVMMLLALGVVGGFNMIYPTIAVEASDSFDAMARSFSYVYARPWRLGFYVIVSLVYFVLTFLFVSFALYLLLLAVHTFLGVGMNLGGFNMGAYSGETKLETIWPGPTMGDLAGHANWHAMSWGEFIAAWCVHLWVYVLIAGLGAYAMTFYHSANTIVYLLLRRSVDGQSITDVYEEEAQPPAATPA